MFRKDVRLNQSRDNRQKGSTRAKISALRWPTPPVELANYRYAHTADMRRSGSVYRFQFKHSLQAQYSRANFKSATYEHMR